MGTRARSSTPDLFSAAPAREVYSRSSESAKSAPATIHAPPRAIHSRHVLPNDLPKAVTLRRIIPYAHADFKEWLEDRKNRRSIPHRFEACHYVPVRNDEVKDKLWKIGDRREVVYAPDELNREDQITAAKKLK